MIRKTSISLNLKGTSNYLNMRQTYLESDFKASNAPAPTYDSDLENFWTQKSNETNFNKAFCVQS